MTEPKGGIAIPITPYIPTEVTVHLGYPSADADNVTVSFPDYIKNVASSEIYPTWPEQALRANILAQISFTLNRIYTEYYRSRGYDFDITSDTSVDQAFVPDRDIFENVSWVVDEIFNQYIRREGSVEPLFAQYCDGVLTTCSGLSQWGSFTLANEGQSYMDILRYYYGDDIELVSGAPLLPPSQTYPGYPLQLGSVGNAVQLIQTRLNRISTNFPNIPKISPVNGVFDQNTLNAVLNYQETFNLEQDGIVGQGTWYSIASIYAAVKRLNDLNSEGVSYDEITLPYPEELKEGDEGVGVRQIQYFLAYLAEYFSTIPSIAADGIYGPRTAEAVRVFQQLYGLPVTGVVDAQTYKKLFDVYTAFIDSLPDDQFVNAARPYPGRPLVLGSSGDSVRYLQQYLDAIAQVYPNLPRLEADGDYGEQTRDAVYAFQSLFGLDVTGVVGSVTWDAIAGLYDDLRAGEGGSG